MKHNKLMLGAAVAFALSASSLHAVDLQLRNVDPPGVGFNDPTPASPVGGNAGTTVGEQRLIAYQKALELWGKTLAGDVTVIVQGSFAPLTCTAGGGTLAQAGALQIWSDFPERAAGCTLVRRRPREQHRGRGPRRAARCPTRTAMRSSRTSTATSASRTASPDRAGTTASTAHRPAGAIDFLDTFMHEVSHGLGFQNFVSEATGILIAGLPDMYMANTLDLSLGQNWNDPAFFPVPANIVNSAVRNGQIVWSGPQVSANAGFVLGDFTGLRHQRHVDIPELFFGTAAFGPAATPDNFAATLCRAWTA